MSKFKVGDRVVGIGIDDGFDINAKIGIVKVSSTQPYAGVDFGEGFCGHCLSGELPSGTGLFVSDDNLNLIENKKIIITSDGNKTTARLMNDKRTIKETNAMCSPDDTYDFETGAKLAFERLMGKGEEPHYYNGKVVCVDLNGYNLGVYTKGKIYQFKDGIATDDRGNKFPNCTIEGFKGLEMYSSSKWLEIVE